MEPLARTVEVWPPRVAVSLSVGVALALGLSSLSGLIERLLYAQQYVVGAAVVVGASHQSPISARVRMAAMDNPRILVFEAGTTQSDALREQAARLVGNQASIDNSFALVELSTNDRTPGGGCNYTKERLALREGS